MVLLTAVCLIGRVVGTACTVCNNNDSGPGSLRAAILCANAGGGEIVFATNVTGKILLLSTLPSLTANTTITGPGASVLTVSGSNNWRIASMNAGTTNTISGLTFADGQAQGFTNYTFASGISNAGSLKLLSCVVSNCSNYLSYGVGIYNAGNLDMEDCLVTDCYDVFGSETRGGGVYNAGTLQIKNCTISNCLGGGNSGGGGGIYNEGTMSASGSMIVSCQGDLEGDGGGIVNTAEATLDTCVVSNCAAFLAGGIKTFGNLSMTNCSVLDSEANDGGGILVLGTAVLSGCTIAGNVAYFDGGGINNFGTSQLYNCTVSQNTLVNDSGSGAGISDGLIEGFTNATTLYLEHCTVVSNTGPNEISTANSLNASHSVLADCIGALISSAGHNLVLNTAGCTLTGNTAGNLCLVDAHLGPLQNNGGPTWTHALLAGSPAIDAGSLLDAALTDQRGISRPQGVASDIGAYEFQYTVPKIVRAGVESRTNMWLQWSGLPGGAYTLQASSNFVSWANLTNLVAGCNGVSELIDRDASKCAFRFYRLLLPVPAGSLYLPAVSGVVTPPFTISNNCLYQPFEATLDNGGRAVCMFTVPKAGTYWLQALVNAPSQSANSFFVNMDAEPQDPCMICDLPLTAGLEQRPVSWRGNGTFDNNQFAPKIFNLAEGPHELVIRGREAATCLQSFALVPTNFAPVVSAISQNPPDADVGAAGVQATAGTTVQYSCSASDPHGAPLTWQWLYTLNGGPEVVVQSGSGAVPAISFSYGMGAISSNYVWTLRASNSQVSAQAQLPVTVEAPGVPPQGLTVPAPLGMITSPFVSAKSYIYTPFETTLANAGSAVFKFIITNAGNYVVQGLVNATSASANSFWLNLDSQPQDPYMIWDVTPLTSGFKLRTANWRGNGTDTSDQFVPAVFPLGPGLHTLIIQGREANTLLQSVTILPYP